MPARSPSIPSPFFCESPSCKSLFPPFYATNSRFSPVPTLSPNYKLGDFHAMQPDITILELVSEAAGRRFQSAMFSGDTDMVTDGWIALSSIDRREIVITMVTSEEHQAPDGFSQCETRVNAELGRADLRAVWLTRAEARGDLYYRDIFVGGDDARLVSKMSVREFEQSGGKILHYAVA